MGLYIFSWKQLILKKKMRAIPEAKHASLLICHGDWTEEISFNFGKEKQSETGDR